MSRNKTNKTKEGRKDHGTSHVRHALFLLSALEHPTIKSPEYPGMEGFFVAREAWEGHAGTLPPTILSKLDRTVGEGLCFHAFSRHFLVAPGRGVTRSLLVGFPTNPTDPSPAKTVMSRERCLPWPLLRGGGPCRGTTSMLKQDVDNQQVFLFCCAASSVR
jgi:hypothetical protein